VIPDRNKTELTHKITDAAFQWLDNHGFKPVETEVGMPWSTNGENQKGWIADLSAVIDPTQTELINLRSCKRPPQYRYGHKNEGYDERRAAWETEYKKVFRLMTCLVEVKASRSDFIGDRKWKLTPPTDLAWIALAPGIATVDECPAGWGILVMRGEQIQQVRVPTPRVATVEEQLLVIYQIAIRRDHRQRYAAEREWQKEDRIRRGVEESRDRLRDIIHAVKDIAAGKCEYTDRSINSIEEALLYHGVRNARDHELKMLAELFGIAAKRQPASPTPSSPTGQPS
jgi:hypothetical protein